MNSMIRNKLNEHFQSLVILVTIGLILCCPVCKLLIAHSRIKIPLLAHKSPYLRGSLQCKQHQRDDVVSIAILAKATMCLWFKWLVEDILGNATSKAEVKLGKLTHVSNLECMPAHSDLSLQSTVMKGSM